MAQANKYRRFGLNLGRIFEVYTHYPAAALTTMRSASCLILA